MPQAPKGTRDIIGKDYQAFRYIIETAERVIRSTGANPIETPMFEETAVFEKAVGASTDIVRKEMYTFTDRGGRSLTLRPEGTAGIVRAYLENGMKVWPQPVRLYTYGPMFRAENVQRGRFRQFHQIDYEAIGSADPLVDAEAIALLVKILQELGLTGLEVKLGSVGDPEDRKQYNAYLRGLLSPSLERLSKDSKDRLELNPMRILDSKDQKDQVLLKELGARPMLDFLGPEAKRHFEDLQKYLRALGVNFSIDPSIVRGLDYYVRTAFEVHHARIGAQSALCGGGRYDGLAEMLGGPHVPGVGWAFGIERIAIAMEEEGFSPSAEAGPDLLIVPLDEKAREEALVLAQQLRPKFRVEFLYTTKSPRKGLEDALKRQATFVAFLGEAERSKGVVTLKHLARGSQEEVYAQELAAKLGARI